MAGKKKIASPPDTIKCTESDILGLKKELDMDDMCFCKEISAATRKAITNVTLKTIKDIREAKELEMALRGKPIDQQGGEVTNNGGNVAILKFGDLMKEIAKGNGNGSHGDDDDNN